MDNGCYLITEVTTIYVLHLYIYTLLVGGSYSAGIYVYQEKNYVLNYILYILTNIRLVFNLYGKVIQCGTSCLSKMHATATKVRQLDYYMHLEISILTFTGGILSLSPGRASAFFEALL